jgi:hypothetical protein
MMVWAENEEALQLFPNGKYAIGLAQVSGMGAPADRSSGAAPFLKNQTLMPESSSFMAYIPPLLALNGGPNDVWSLDRMPQPASPNAPAPDSQSVPTTVPVIPRTLESLEDMVQPGEVWSVAWLRI